MICTAALVCGSDDLAVRASSRNPEGQASGDARSTVGRPHRHRLPPTPWGAGRVGQGATLLGSGSFAEGYLGASEVERHQRQRVGELLR